MANPPRTSLITGVSSGFGRALTGRLLGRGDTVVGTVRREARVADLAKVYAETSGVELLDSRDLAAIRGVVERSFAEPGPIDVVVSNAGYGRISIDQAKVRSLTLAESFPGTRDLPSRTLL